MYIYIYKLFKDELHIIHWNSYFEAFTCTTVIGICYDDCYLRNILNI